MATTVFAARRALRDLLVDALPAVTVAYGDPVARDDLEQVTFTGYGPIDGDTPMFGPREERYTLDLVVSVLGPDSDAEEVDVRAEELVNVVLEVLAANPQLGLPGVIVDAHVSSFDTVGAIPTGEGGSICGVDLSVEVMGFS
jgi:hypothetical protein